MIAPLLLTKLFVPTPPQKGILRPRLVNRLNEGLSCGHKLTLISAPAGFGKTTLVSEWVAECKQAVAWISLDEGDKDPARFLTYLVLALQSRGLEFGPGMVKALQGPQMPHMESFLVGLLNEITRVQSDFILVLDDYHVIDSRPIDHALAFLLDHMPPQMHLVITTREDPHLPIARLRARDQLSELRASDLRLTPEESGEFLRQAMGKNLADEDVAALETRTEGWIAGLQLAALSMQNRQDIPSFIQSFTGSHRYVLDYLVEEVLEQQSEDVQSFLLRTSILDQLCGSLCDTVLLSCSGPAQAPVNEVAASQKVLEHLERANLFVIPMDNERKWYRYHHLFGSLLRHRLEQEYSPTEIAGLHIRASAWFEENDLTFEAFQHAAIAQDIERAERLMESKEMPLHFHHVVMAVCEWLDSLPATDKNKRPLLWVRSATLALVAGQTADVEENLHAAEIALGSLKQDARVHDLIGQIACARATLALTRYQPDVMLVQAYRALEYLSPENLTYRFTANWALTSASLLKGDRATTTRACLDGIAISQESGNVFSNILATTNLGRLQELQNQLYQAADTYQRVLALSGENPNPNAGEAHLGLARIYYQWNELDTAEQHVSKSLQLTRQFDRRIDRFILSEIFLAKLILARGEAKDAEIMLAETELTARQKNFLLRLPDIAAAQVSVLLSQGNLVAAGHLARQYDLPLSQALVCIAQENPSGALDVLKPYCQQMETRGWIDEQLRAMVLLVVALHLKCEKDQAAKLLDEALALAEPGGFIRLFVDEGAALVHLLREAEARGVAPVYVRKLLTAIEKEKQERAPDSGVSSTRFMVEPLSRRELEVLRLIEEGLSNQEISERLFLALDTVKGHNRRIFEKLQVQRRTEAIARAREAGLL